MAKLWTALGANRRVRFARLRAAFWVLLGVASFPLGWASSVVLVWIASVYANSESAITSAEAADDSKVMAAVAEVRAELTGRLDAMQAILERLAGSPTDEEQQGEDAGPYGRHAHQE